MNLLVAGIHGVGKTFLATQCAEEFGFLYASASRLIREERELVTWDIDKHVGEIDENQVALTSAVQRHNTAGHRLLLDGHFVLLDQDGRITPIDAPLFSSLHLVGVMLIENHVDTILKRNEDRGSHRWSAELVENLLLAERTQAQIVCKELGLELLVLSAPTMRVFSEALGRLVRSKK